jgi:hypothetical protein
MDPHLLLMLGSLEIQRPGRQGAAVSALGRGALTQMLSGQPCLSLSTPYRTLTISKLAQPSAARFSGVNAGLLEALRISGRRLGVGGEGSAAGTAIVRLAQPRV